MKRSNKPIFWSLFGAGGMLAALAGPALVFVTGLAPPLGWVPLAYARSQALAAHPPGKAAVAAVIGLFLFHGCHRLYHSLHDLGVHVGPGIKAACHGFAAAGTAVALALLMAL